MRSVGLRARGHATRAHAGGAEWNTIMQCSGCGAEVDSAVSAVFSCPNAESCPEQDHVLAPVATVAVDGIGDHAAGTAAEQEMSVNPFMRYRKMLLSYRVARARGMSDDGFVSLVSELDDGLARLDGTGFVKTPLTYDKELNCWLKNETGNVAQSHKARHLMGVMIYLRAMRDTGYGAGEPWALERRRLAVASCGNAGLAAATVAAAAGWPIDVCIPPDASPVIVERLKHLGADVVVCARDTPTAATTHGAVSTIGEGDPCMLAFKALVQQRQAIPFSVQGPECGFAQEGGQTLAWEAVEAAAAAGAEGFANVYIQVGGGALGASFVHGMRRAVSGELAATVDPAISTPASMPIIHTVQPTGNAPLARALCAVIDARVAGGTTPANPAHGATGGGLRLETESRGALLHGASLDRGRFMFPWKAPHSIASGILDDETYDWLALCDGMLETGGSTFEVGDDIICEAKQLAEDKVKALVCHTGSAGLAGLLHHRREHEQQQGVGDTPVTGPDFVILSGLHRDK